MPRNVRLRFLSEKEGEKYQYARTVNTVIAIVGCISVCVISLAIYATVRHGLLFTIAGCSAGLGVALWFLTKPPATEEP